MQQLFWSCNLTKAVIGLNALLESIDVLVKNYYGLGITNFVVYYQVITSLAKINWKGSINQWSINLKTIVCLTCGSHGTWLNCMSPRVQVTTGLGFFLCSSCLCDSEDPTLTGLAFLSISLAGYCAVLGIKTCIKVFARFLIMK